MGETVTSDRPSAGVVFSALALVVGVMGWAWMIFEPTPAGRALSFSLLTGATFGVLLQRSRFCFFCVTRDYLERRDPNGLIGLLAALAVGTLGYHAVLGSFVPDPFSGRLPPDAHVGPVSLVLVLGAGLFGLGMAISGSCISAHLYRLGEGAFASVFALIGVLIGFVLGFFSWNPLYLRFVADAPTIWLPGHLGYAGSLIGQLAVLSLLAWLLLRYARPQAASAEVLSVGQHIWRRRWPGFIGGVLIGALAVVCYLRVGPLGVTAELGSLSRTGANALGWLPDRLHGLDGFSGCATVIKQALLSNNGAFISALVLGAWASALIAGDWQPALPGVGQALRSLFGGVLMGWGAMLALGCTVGTLLSGIMAAALSGWVFALFCLGGLLAGLGLRRVLHW